MNPRTRSVILVLEDDTTDTEAALVRNGLSVFRHVRQVIPVRGVPTDGQAARLIAKDDLTRELRLVTQQRDELASRLEGVQAAATGPVPVSGTEGAEVEWKRSS